jgi:uncharacterized membrane protein YcaP (DUF421 family)
MHEQLVEAPADPGTTDVVTPEFDLSEMLLGDVSWAVLGEIVLRTAVMYAYTLGIIRVVGKRGVGQLSPFELVIIVALGSAVGDPMLYLDVPLVHGIVVITVVVLLQRALEELTEDRRSVERLLEGTPRRLVLNGDIDRKALEAEQLSESELFVALREQGIEHLGQVRLAYLEPSGRISVFRADLARAGRSVLPD